MFMPITAIYNYYLCCWGDSYMCYLYPLVLNFTPFAFWVIRMFETSVPNGPKMTLNPTRSNVLHICVISIHARVPNFTLLRSSTSHFRDTFHFETSAPNDRKITLDPTRSKCTPYVLLVSMSLSSFSPFHSTVSRVSVTGHFLKNLHWMTPEWPWILQGQRCPM